MPGWIAKKYLPKSGVLRLDDLVAEGNLALVRAAQRFDPNRGAAFRTFATAWIEGSLKRAIRDKGGQFVRQRSDRKGDFVSYEIAVGDLLESGIELSVAAIVERSGLDEKFVKKQFLASEGRRNVGYLDRPLWDDGLTTLGESIESRGEELDTILDRVILEEAIKYLPDRLARLVEYRFGVPQGVPHTQVETGKKLSISQIQVSRLEKEALELLRGVIPSANES